MKKIILRITLIVFLISTFGCKSGSIHNPPIYLNFGSWDLPNQGCMDYFTLEDMPFFVIVWPQDLPEDGIAHGGDFSNNNNSVWLKKGGEYLLYYQVYKDARAAWINGQIYNLDKGSIFVMRRDFSVVQTPFHYVGTLEQLKKDPRLMAIYKSTY